MWRPHGGLVMQLRKTHYASLFNADHTTPASSPNRWMIPTTQTKSTGVLSAPVRSRIREAKLLHCLRKFVNIPPLPVLHENSSVFTTNSLCSSPTKSQHTEPLTLLWSEWNSNITFYFYLTLVCTRIQPRTCTGPPEVLQIEATSSAASWWESSSNHHKVKQSRRMAAPGRTSDEQTTHEESTDSQ